MQAILVRNPLAFREKKVVPQNDLIEKSSPFQENKVVEVK